MSVSLPDLAHYGMLKPKRPNQTRWENVNMPGLKALCQVGRGSLGFKVVLPEPLAGAG